MILITPALKDKLLKMLCENCELERVVQINTGIALQKLELDFVTLNAILCHFERLGIIQDANIREVIIFLCLKTEAHDLFSRGGFSASEEIFKANIEKLGFEVDKLRNEGDPKLLDCVNALSGISSALFGGLALFKDRI